MSDPNSKDCIPMIIEAWMDKAQDKLSRNGYHQKQRRNRFGPWKYQSTGLSHRRLCGVTPSQQINSKLLALDLPPLNYSKRSTFQTPSTDTSPLQPILPHHLPVPEQTAVSPSHFQASPTSRISPITPRITSSKSAAPHQITHTPRTADSPSHAQTSSNQRTPTSTAG
jgi:hypothetical protein